MPVKCPYCGQHANLVFGDDIYQYRPDLSTLQFWLCEPCGAWVGCHQGTQKPLGRLADADLRKAKMAAHSAFDPIWRSGRMKRKEAYAWLAHQLDIPSEQCHVGMFDLEKCEEVVNVCEIYFQEAH